MTLTVNVKVETVDDLLDIVDPHNGAGFQLKCLLALRDRVIKDSGISVGCRARIKQTIQVERSSGWWHYRQSLIEGALGSISEISFRSQTGTMYCAWVPDREWSLAYRPGEKPGDEHWTSRPGTGSFLLRADELEVVGDAV